MCFLPPQPMHPYATYTSRPITSPPTSRSPAHHDATFSFSLPAPLTACACSPSWTCASSFATASGLFFGAPFTSFLSPDSGLPASRSSVFDLLGLNGTGVDGLELRNYTLSAHSPVLTSTREERNLPN